MDSAKLQADINKLFLDNFGKTPLDERLSDILKQANELAKYKDIPHLREKTADLLAATVQLCNECEWHISTLSKENSKKILRSSIQYKGLGRKFKIAIYGGAFDPVTKGHIDVANFLLNSGQFDQVWIMPAYKHMYGKKMANSLERTRMIDLSINDKRITIFNFEIDNKLFGETYKTVKLLLSDVHYTDLYDFYFVMGLDNANTFDKWVNYKELEKIAKFIVVSRKGIEENKNINWYFKEPHIYLKDTEGIISDTSSTLAKYYIAQEDEEGLKMQLDPKVIHYIKENFLYK